MTSLFRRESIENRRVALLGDATLPLPVSTLQLTLFLVAVVAALCCFMALGKYARREHASGFLVSTHGAAKIMPPRPGIIVDVYVAEGELVDQDATLLSVNDEQTTNSGEGADEAKLVALRQQQQQLREQVAIARQKTEVERTALGDAIDALSAELTALQATHQTQAIRVSGSHDQLTAVAETALKGITSLTELQRRRDTWLSQIQTEQNIAREILSKQAELARQRRALEQLPLNIADQVSHVESAITEVEIKVIEISEHRGYVLRAPVSGRVSALQAWVGKTAEPGIPQLSIVPQDAVLRAELLVPARAIGFVTKGQSVRLSYDPFPHQQFGFADGFVDTVSYTLLKPNELVGPFVLKEPSYRIGVALPSQSVLAYGRQIPLQADMQLQGSILFERRSLLAWLLDPLRSITGSGG